MEAGSFWPYCLWVIRTRVDPLDIGCQNIGHLETSGDRAMQLMTVSAAARHLGYKSRSQLYKLMNDGWLDGHLHIQMPSGQRLLRHNAVEAWNTMLMPASALPVSL